MNLHGHCGWALTPPWPAIRVQTDETKDPMEGDANSCHTVDPTDGAGGEKLTRLDFKFILGIAAATSSRLIIEKGPGQVLFLKEITDLKIVTCKRRASG